MSDDEWLFVGASAGLGYSLIAIAVLLVEGDRWPPLHPFRLFLRTAFWPVYLALGRTSD